MRARVAPIVAAAALALGCRGRGGGSDAGATDHDAGASAARADAGRCTPEEVAGPYADLCLSPAEVEAFAATLREAVLRHDAATVASLVRYPFRVHTAFCTKHLAAPAELVAHYDEVFTAALRGDILATKPPFFVRDQSIMLAEHGHLWARVGDDRRLLLGGVSHVEGDLAGVPCADRVEEPIPDTVWGTWAVSSVRAGELEDIVSFPWQAWKGLTISLDRATRKLKSKLGGQEKTCDVVGYARDTGPEPDVTTVVPRCSAFETFYGPHVAQRSRLLQGSCVGPLAAVTPAPGASVDAELLMIDDGTMVVRLACEGIAVLKKRTAQELAARRRFVPKGAPCGALDVDCAPGARCVAVSANPLTERCEGLDEHAG